MAFYKTVVTVEVLTDVPFEWNGLANLAYETMEGGASAWVDYSSEKITKETLVVECAKHATDPGFFLYFEDEDEA